MSNIFAIAQVEEEGNPIINLKKAEKIIKKAKQNNAKIVIFPELFMSHFQLNYSLKIRNTYKESINGSFVSKMKIYAKTNNIWVIFGIRELCDISDEKIYNTIIILNNYGELIKYYRKTHLYDAYGFKESDLIEPGNELFYPIKTPFGNLGLLVCYELRFPEIARYEMKKGAEIIIVPTAWVKGENKEMQFKTLIKSRAIENSVYMVVSNLCGQDCIGESSIIDPTGNILCKADKSETIIYYDIDLNLVKDIRKVNPTLNNLRENLYR